MKFGRLHEDSRLKSRVLCIIRSLSMYSIRSSSTLAYKSGQSDAAPIYRCLGGSFARRQQTWNLVVCMRILDSNLESCASFEAYRCIQLDPLQPWPTNPVNPMQHPSTGDLVLLCARRQKTWNLVVCMRIRLKSRVLCIIPNLSMYSIRSSSTLAYKSGQSDAAPIHRWLGASLREEAKNMKFGRLHEDSRLKSRVLCIIRSLSMYSIRSSST